MVISYLMELALANEGVLVDRGKWVALKFVNLAKSTDRYIGVYELYINMFRSEMTDDTDCLRKLESSVATIQTEIEKIILGDLII
jgi:hypothetical protein